MTMRLVDRFNTHDGSWEPDGRPYSITPAAAAKYGDCPGKGGATHIFVKAPVGAEIHFETVGSSPVTADRTVDASGWVNLPMFHSSAYGDANGGQGPWEVFANGDKVASGIGLPNGWHVSTFLIVDDVQVPPVMPPPSSLRATLEQIRKLADDALGAL